MKVTHMQGVVSAIASGGHGGYGHSSHGIGTACIVKVGADLIFKSSLCLFLFFGLPDHPLKPGISKSRVGSLKCAFLVFQRDPRLSF